MLRYTLPLLIAVAPAPAQADVVCEWMDFAYRTIDTQPAPPPGALREPTHTRVRSEAALAIYEALDAIDRRYESYLGLPQAEPTASQEAAVASAAFTVLASHYPAQKSALDENYAIALQSLPDNAARKAGIAAGEAAAAAVLKRPLVDPKITAKPYLPRTTPGVWVPTALPVFEPWNGTLSPWFVKSPTQFAPPPPPALTSAVWQRDFDEVKRLGSRTSSERTAHQTLMARYRITPNMMPTMRTIADQQGRPLVENARLFALAEMVGDDAMQTLGEAKLTYNFWRPITAIRNAGDDGNPATEADPGWTPLIATPNHPEYPCGHCTYASATATVLKAEVGNAPRGGVRVASFSLPQSAVQVLPTFDDWVKEVSLSRILGGVHYRFANDAGEAVGRDVAEYALANYMRPIAPARTAKTTRR